MFYPSKLIQSSRLVRIHQISGCLRKTRPFKYLGALIYKGRCKSQYFEEMIEKLARRLKGWVSRFLSFGGKVTLIRFVVLTLPTHISSCMVVQRQVRQRLEGHMAEFLWSQKGQTRTHWVSWQKICRPIDEGGLGIRSLEDTVYGLHGNLAWKFLSQDSLWIRMLLQKYGVESIYEDAHFRSGSSKLWKVLIPHFHNLLDTSHWQVRRRGISFWCAKWCGKAINPIFGRELMVREGVHNIQHMEHLLTYEQIPSFQ